MPLEDVRIAPWLHGHIQALGTDARPPAVALSRRLGREGLPATRGAIERAVIPRRLTDRARRPEGTKFAPPPKQIRS